jgi:hypothetical protein
LTGRCAGIQIADISSFAADLRGGTAYASGAAVGMADSDLTDLADLAVATTARRPQRHGQVVSFASCIRDLVADRRSVAGRN